MGHETDQRSSFDSVEGVQRLTPATPKQAKHAEKLAKELRELGADPDKVVHNFWRKVAERGVVFKHTLPYIEKSK
jgi:hypothetical protein